VQQKGHTQPVCGGRLTDGDSYAGGSLRVMDVRVSWVALLVLCLEYSSARFGRVMVCDCR